MQRSLLLKKPMCFFQWNVNTYSCTPPFIQMAAKEALDNPQNKHIVACMRSEFQRRRDVVVEALNRIDGFTCTMPKGTFYAFPNICGVCQKLGILEYFSQQKKKGKHVAHPSALFQKFALHIHGVATLGRVAFGTIESEGQHFIRLSLASDLETLKEGVRRLESASKDSNALILF